MILGTIGLGAALAFVPGVGGRALGPVRMFALTAAVAVVAVHLVPEALEAIGPAALLGVIAGLALPTVLERTLGAGERLAFEVGFVGLLLHAVGDGVALWTFVRPGEVQPAAAVALAAHMVPVTTVLVLHDVASPKRALLRAAAMALFTALGLWAADHWVERGLPAVQPWIGAVASGLLLHVVAHDLPGARRPRGAAELIAAVAGVLLALAGSIFHTD